MDNTVCFFFFALLMSSLTKYSVLTSKLRKMHLVSNCNMIQGERKSHNDPKFLLSELEHILYLRGAYDFTIRWLQTPLIWPQILRHQRNWSVCFLYKINLMFVLIAPLSMLPKLSVFSSRRNSKMFLSNCFCLQIKHHLNLTWGFGRVSTIVRQSSSNALDAWYK